MINPISNEFPTNYELKPTAAGSVKTPSGEYIDENSAEARALKRSGAIDCETCKNRKYVDGSDETDVSFKAPGHISPQASTSAVRAHEQQHVANAYQKEAKGAKVISATVSIKMAQCPECGRSYAAGGQTNTTIKYNSDSYSQNTKGLDAANGIAGKNFETDI